jgi:hypothetical protein
MKIARFSALAALAFALVSGSSQAAFVPLPTTLDQLISGTPVTPGTNTTGVGNLTFSGFSYTLSGSAVPASSISLAAIDSVGLQIAGPFGATSPNAGDSLISFTASSTTGISSITLGGNPAVTGAGVASITETFYSSYASFIAGGAALGQILVNPTTPGLSATFNFGTAVASVYIRKDILYSAAIGGTAQISFVTQTFTTGVPEPASVVMMGLGLVGAVGVVRFRRTRVA